MDDLRLIVGLALLSVTGAGASTKVISKRAARVVEFRGVVRSVQGRVMKIRLERGTWTVVIPHGRAIKDGRWGSGEQFSAGDPVTVLYSQGMTIYVADPLSFLAFVRPGEYPAREVQLEPDRGVLRAVTDVERNGGWLEDQYTIGKQTEFWLYGAKRSVRAAQSLLPCERMVHLVHASDNVSAVVAVFDDRSWRAYALSRRQHK